MIFGAVRLGALVRFIPSPVMAGFQNAAALLILYSQLHIMLGLPHRLPPSALYAALADAKLLNLALGAATVAVIWTGGRLSRHLPPALLGLVFGTLVYYLLVAVGLEARLGPTIGPIAGGSPDGITSAPCWRSRFTGPRSICCRLSFSSPSASRSWPHSTRSSARASWKA